MLATHGPAGLIVPLAQDDPAWTLVDVHYCMGGFYDREIVRALRAIDPRIAPLWLVKVYRTPTWAIVECGRHLLARHIDQPRGVTRTGRAANPAHIYVDLPHPCPPELRGLPRGPYLEAELLEGESPDGGLSPGPYEPMTWELVRRLEAATYALRNHRIEELNAQRIHRAQRNRQRHKRDIDDLKEQRRLEAARLLNRTFGHLDWAYMPREVVREGRTTMSAQLARLKKIARGEGVEDAA